MMGSVPVIWSFCPFEWQYSPALSTTAFIASIFCRDAPAERTRWGHMRLFVDGEPYTEGRYPLKFLQTVGATERWSGWRRNQLGEDPLPESLAAK